MTPTSKVNVSSADSASSELDAMPAEMNVAAVEVAIVDVVLTLAVWEPPRRT